MKEFDIGRFLLLPNRKLCGFIVEAEPKPGVLSKISAVPAAYNAVILCVSYSMPSLKDKTIRGLGFVDLTNTNISAEKIAEEMRNLKGVKKVEVIQSPIEGFIADACFHRILMGGERAIILRKWGYSGLISGVRERFGTGGEAFLYYFGFEAGIKYGRSHMEIGLKLGLADPIKIAQLICVHLFNSVGFGKLKIMEIKADPPKAIFRIYDSFECELGLKSGKPYSQLIRGMIAGYLSIFFNRRMKAKEVKCIAKGDPYCEFMVEPE